MIVSTIFLGGHMDTKRNSPPASRTHRRHSPEFKARVIAACLQPGVSIAAIALANQLNANFLRGWVKAYRDRQRAEMPVTPNHDDSRVSANCPPTTFVPVALPVTEVQPPSSIQIEIRRHQAVFQIAWPVSESTAFAQWLRDVLR